MDPESHPIFKSQPFEAGCSKRFVCNSSTSFKTVVVEGSTVKWCMLHEPDYQYVDFKPIQDYVEVVLNSSGTLLCLHNSQELQILTLDKNSNQPNEYKIPASAGVKQVLWHPNARLDSCLVVLTASDEICMFELLSDDYTKPTTVLNSSAAKYGMGSIIRDITSMSFSSDGMSLYLLNTSEGADVYSLYPFLPSDATLSEETIKYSFHKALLQYQELTDGDSSELKRRATKQLQFSSKLNSQLQDHIKGRSDSSALDLTISKALRNSAIQGPYTINPFPESLYLATAVQLETLKFGEHTELVLITFDDGTILQCFPDLEPMMSWENSESCHNNSLVSVGSLKSPGIISLVCDSNFVVLSPQKAVLVSLKRLTQAMEQSLSDYDARNLNEDLSEQILQQEGAFDAAGVWSAGSHIVLLSKNSTSHFDVPFSAKLMKKKQDEPHKEIVAHRRPYDQPMAELIALNDKAQTLMKTPLSTAIEPRLRQSKLDNACNEEQLSLLTNISKEILNRVVIGQTLALSIHSRLMGQQDELAVQLRKVCEVRNKKEEASKKYTAQQDRWTSVQAKNQAIKSRFESLRDKLMEFSTSDKVRSQEISHTEMEWFKEIKNQIARFNRLVHSQRDLSENLSILKTELEYVQVEGRESGDSTRSTDVSWEELRELLAKDAKIIGECQVELQGTASELN
ncbi:LANO_0H02036g1_1 [Lachancea nothofagi CBS 11611]|uniref:LANO_0H02036g1_1 n=1 Tax=Lachancea nothofagi CBS 11611 TaxID=1266666 RepID=A0A1G4KKU8_9SACH|nr:LANO_0H02036g1_1 [Lachancea nothofagi CBS 11611]